jgi:mannose-6-phosphate isomerase-like protein (cupin superfamily)
MARLSTCTSRARTVRAVRPRPGSLLALRYDSFALTSANFVIEAAETMNYFIDWQEHTGTNPEKFYKTTLWQGQQVMTGLNCLEPNQSQSVHAHQGADKFYFVLEGRGRFTIGDEEREAGTGTLVIAPAGVPHGVMNKGDERLSLLVGIAPGIK